MSEGHVQPADAFAIFQEAHAQHAAGQLDKAIPLYKASLDLSFAEPAILRDYGAALHAAGESEEAIKYLEYSLAYDEHDPLTHHQCALACGEVGRDLEQKRHYDRALELAPHSALFMWNRSLWYLLHRDYKNGFRDYAWGRGGVNRKHRTVRPHATKETITAMKPGQTLFVWCEQGMGDTIQFARFLKPLRGVVPDGVRVVLEVQFELYRLLRDLPYADKVIIASDTGAIPFHDFEHVSLMDIPAILEIFDEDAFDIGPYLEAQSPAIYDDRLHIGFVWAGNPGHGNDKRRSMSVEMLKPLMSLEGISAHYWVNNLSLGVGINHGVESFARTANEVAGLDLVVTVDTSMAHLAGAMGKKVLLMVPFVPDWRWSMDRTYSPWYRGVQIFRQPSTGDWASVIEDVRNAIEVYTK